MPDDNFLRQSQVVTSFGPGALVDLPDHSVIVGGLGTWKGQHLHRVHEQRLERKLAQALDVQTGLKLYAPPPFDERDEQRRNAIGGFVFPTWFETQATVAGGGGRHRRRRLVGWAGTERGRYYIDPQETGPKSAKKRLVPVRFVCGCKRGHIDDIDWHWYVHRGEKGCTRALWIEERGTAGDVADVVVGCDCGQERRMYEALTTGALGGCRGNRPWLGNIPWEGCNQPNKLLVRTGSNTYFPERMSVISLPEGDDRLTQAIERNWDNLKTIRTADDLAMARRFNAALIPELEGFADADILRGIQAQAADAQPDTERSVKEAEFEVLSCGRPSVGADGPDSLFHMRTLDRAAWVGSAEDPAGVLRVAAVDRLREVIAQVGFTRIAPPATEVDGELDPEIERAALDVQHDWLPAFENRGEGVFVQLDQAAVAAWEAEPAVAQRAEALKAGFLRWAAARGETKRKFPGAPYVMVHTFAHLLLTAVAEECGYPASALRERVYALPGQYGILLYTATPGADGTLGGLAACARRIGALVWRAAELAALCSNDPICAHHGPDDVHADRPLHGAACHGCVFVAETSCEQRNDLLDRSLVTDTLEAAGAGFFPRSAVP